MRPAVVRSARMLCTDWIDVVGSTSDTARWTRSASVWAMDSRASRTATRPAVALSPASRSAESSSVSIGRLYTFFLVIQKSPRNVESGEADALLQSRADVEQFIAADRAGIGHSLPQHHREGAPAHDHHGHTAHAAERSHRLRQVFIGEHDDRTAELDSTGLRDSAHACEQRGHGGVHAQTRSDDLAAAEADDSAEVLRHDAVEPRRAE